MRRPLHVVAFVLLPLVLFLPSCIVAAAAMIGAAAAGAVSYDHNEASMDFKATLTETWQATVRAMRHLGYKIEGDPMPGATDGTIAVDKTKVVVELHPGGYVRVRASVGTFDTDDNERRAKLIIEEVTQQMPRLRP